MKLTILALIVAIFVIYEISLASGLGFWETEISTTNVLTSITGFQLGNDFMQCQAGYIRPCGSNIGTCQAGVRRCINGRWSECIGGTTPTSEVLDGFDNNCNGQIDEDFECTKGDTKLCGSNVGICEQGIRTCPDGHWSDCLGGKNPEPVDLCDGFDNNCNGDIDENCPTGCDDGTVFLECSTLQPLYCDDQGTLDERCEICGCPFEGDECIESGECLRNSHIKTAGVFYGGDMENEDVIWAADKFDMFIGMDEKDLPLVKVHTTAPVLYNDNYFAISYPLYEPMYADSKYVAMKEYAEVNNLNFEDFFLHYGEDTHVDLTDQCVNGRCPICEVDDFDNPECSKSVPDLDNSWNVIWLSSTDPDADGSTAPVVRGWNPADDFDGDGISDREPSNPIATAEYRYESRIPYKWFGSYLVNVANPNYREFNAQYVKSKLNTNIKGSNANYDGVVLENPGPGFPNFATGSVIEYTDANVRGTNFKTDYSITLTYTKSVIGDKLQIQSVATYWIPEYVSGSDGHMQEGAFHDTRTAGLYKLFFDISKQLTDDDKLEIKFGGNTVSGTVERDQMYALSTYYLSKTENTYFLYAGSYTDPQEQWFEAMSQDVGEPLGDYYLYEVGIDPSGTSGNREYEIYAREYENALVMVKFAPWWTSILGDETGTSHTLINEFSRLNVDGTLEEKSNLVSLRNGEGVILIK